MKKLIASEKKLQSRATFKRHLIFAIIIRITFHIVIRIIIIFICLFSSVIFQHFGIPPSAKQIKNR